MTKAPAQVNYLDGRLSKTNQDTVYFDFIIEGNSAQASVNNLVTGLWKLEVFAYDIDQNITHYGTQVVEVMPGILSPVTIYLDPYSGGLIITVRWNDYSKQLLAYYPFNGNASDESGNNNNGVIYGASLTQDRHGNENSACYFDGLDDYINIGNSYTLKPELPVTITAWVYVEKPGYFFDNNHDETNYFGIWMGAGENTFGVGYGDGGPIGPQSRRSAYYTSELPLNQWHFIAGVIWDATNMNLYLNGFLVEDSLAGTGGNLMYNSNNANLGRIDSDQHGASQYFGGKIDELRFYSGALTQEEIFEIKETQSSTP
jgi:hypothetical protein